MSEPAQVIPFAPGSTAGRPVKDLYEIGEIPPLGHVPKRMYAWAIRRDRHGPPESAMQVEAVPTPELAPDEVLVMVMAAGVNYNGVWAALGKPISPFDVHRAEFHVAGSDAVGVVWAIGSKVKRWKVGDEVVVHCNQDDGDDEECNGGDPMFSPSQRIWGYETPDGSFAQFARVQGRQLMERPLHLTWEESGCYVLTLATAYRMLFGHRPHVLRPGQNVLVWGAAGGLGSMAIQLIATAGANAIAVISEDEKRDFVMSLGAKGVINRKKFDCWGRLPDVNATGGYGDYMKKVREFGKAIWQFTGKGNDVDFVFEHPGEQTFPVSWHHRLQPHLRRTLRVDAAEAHPGQPFRQPAAGEPGEPAGGRAAHRSLHVRGLLLVGHPARAHEDVAQRAQARQHGRPRAGQASGHAHARGGGAGLSANGAPASPLPLRERVRSRSDRG